jgi:HK97 family phage major capsid protein
MSITIPPLSSMVVNSDSVMPTAAWAVNGTTPTEGYALVDQTTMTVSTDTVKPMLVGSTVTVQNELLNFPGIGWAELMGVRMMEAIIAKEEYGILAGTVAGAYPSEGVTGTVAGVNAQTALATATVQNLTTFLGECDVDFPGSTMDPNSQLFISPTRYWALAGQAVGTNVGAALAWANAATGAPPIFFGYPILRHAGAVNIAGTTHSVIFGNPKTIVFAHSGQIAVDFNPYATGTNTGWLANNTWMRAMTHSDWSIGAPKAWHKATITA